MGPIWFCFAVGVVAILLRRPLAREFVESQAFWWNLSYSEDGAAWYFGFIGVISIAAGIVFLGIWLFH